MRRYPFRHLGTPWRDVVTTGRSVVDAAFPGNLRPYVSFGHVAGQCYVEIEPRYARRAVAALEERFNRAEVPVG